MRIKVAADSRIGRLIVTTCPRQWLRLTVSPWWARVLGAAGKRTALVLEAEKGPGIYGGG
ncbi:hypothetical protein AB0L00_37995 [Actinoallomurus sp. NPDC052308]|uniref:hypothetical protein n=1 Tax=Actinoallomurus sp. NPDC052308 TaxID=3155530 RepID=UPI0034468362